MAYVTITNKSSHKVDFLQKIAQEIKPFLNLVDKSKYPFRVIVIDKKGLNDRSEFDLESNILYLKVDMTKQTPEEIAWVFAHEFAHFLSNNNPSLKNVALGPEQAAAEQFYQKAFGISLSDVHEIFHDFLPAEVVANFFATLIIGKYYKRHPFNKVVALIKGKQSGKVKTLKEEKLRLPRGRKLRN